jgi:hypothetical protein
MLAHVALLRGDLDRATALFEDVLARQRAAGYPWGLGNALAELAWAILMRGDHARAGALLSEALTVRRAIADTFGLSESLEGAAAVAAARGHHAPAARLTGAAAALREADDFPHLPDELVRYDRNLVPSRAQFGEAAWAVAWAEGRAMPLDEALALAEEELDAGADNA